MLSRKEQKKSGTTLPPKWTKSVSNLLNKIYQKKLEETKREFECFGISYPEELIIAISLINPQDRSSIPATIIMSADLKPNQDSKKLLDVMVDAIGLFFDDYFDQNDWNGWQACWQKISYKNTTFYYQITREDIFLTLEADKLLSSN